ncbi:hypothetical protein NQ318_020230 [Aromia moschata]|uniref:NADH:ubiquinone oxidoreductase intermediate-associated protein 30 domain-containing protein n=1 Tax=Aromia moschata TaxID=1265417 RepID=A0AAV8ZC79_9CUCU|nr:hypothetical protein NQ318_020230 [Aromia moschata]
MPSMNIDFYHFFYLISESYIDNFQTNGEVSSWSELSDTVMAEGKSKSSFVLFKSNLFRRAVLFTMLNPQPCGAAFAGIRKIVDLDISGYEAISLEVRGRGQYKGYEFVLRHKGQAGSDAPSYVYFFEVPFDFEVVRLPIKQFKPYLMGNYYDKGEPLDTSRITSIGILAYGGAHLPKKQQGAAALEVNWIKLE